MNLFAKIRVMLKMGKSTEATKEPLTNGKKKDVECSEAKSETRSCCLRLFRRSFKDPELEDLYLSYNLRQKREGFYCFLVASIIYNLYCIPQPNVEGEFNWTTLAFLLLNVALLLSTYWSVQKCSKVWIGISFSVGMLSISETLQPVLWKFPHISGHCNLGWVMFLNFLLYALLPLRLRYCVLFSLITCSCYLAIIIRFVQSTVHLTPQICANSILLIAANILGIFTYLLSDNQQRRAFLETRQSIEVKLLIEEQSTEQERLLLSVLPEHVAVKMRQDLGSAFDSQFKKIYMSRHENVSILYADIVGFTAISSTYSASELVKILNELFARFDRLSERYHQLRIKILGDCYYCISGAPRERPDHAVLCVHMGLSMVKAIKYVQQTCNSPVDMRVGIHTGAVLAGVLGQTQWQFDVYSKDVELANKMESSGKPGKVHISEKTLSYLNDEFEVEPAFGEKREEVLRMAGIKTYFIVKVLKPFQPSESNVTNGTIAEENTRNGDDDNDVNDKEVDAELGEEENKMLDDKNPKNTSRDFKKRLQRELTKKGGLSTLSEHITWLTLWFKSAKKEKDFNKNKETTATISLLACPMVLFFTSLAQAIILPRDDLTLLSFTMGFTILMIFSVIAIAEVIPAICFKEVVQCSVTVSNILWIRRLLAIVIILVLASCNAVDMVVCDYSSSPLNCTAGGDILTTCLYPSYFSYFCVLVLIAASLPTQISHLVKIAILFAIVSIHCTINIFVILSSFECQEKFENEKYLVISISSMLICVATALSVLARHVEKATRVLFLWKTEVVEQREKASDIMRRNEALVYNILPPHVAVHFLGNRKRQHEELYSQSYAEVGVLFASMPNFSDFYSEESVNNQGLECLRFLNEVISDFDAILQLQRFQDIIKIKTIGSTYMAASGLNPSKVVKPNDPIEVRWAHLALLVEFAFELKKALEGINEQSFNHFVLKMGINHGPITAGVIGARKPHYDIWGNSVNVASRMESTGKAGCIQVTEETCKILQNFGYVFEQRGLVTVKGKGQLMTYYLIGKGKKETEAPVNAEPDVQTKEDLMGDINGTAIENEGPKEEKNDLSKETEHVKHVDNG